jgi:hypothetical protein
MLSGSSLGALRELVAVAGIIAASWMYQDSPTRGKDAKEGEIND